LSTIAQARVARGLLASYLIVAGALGVRGLGLLAWQQRGLAVLAPVAWWLALAATLLGLVFTATALVRLARARKREDSAAFALRGVCVLVALVLVIVWVRGAPYTRLWAEIGAGAVCGLASAWVLVAPRVHERARHARRPVLWRAADIVLFDLALVLVLGELGLGALARWTHWDVLSQPRRHAAQFLEQNRPAPGTLHLGFPMNAGGHYDEAFGPRDPARERIVCIGDSFSASTVPHLFHYTTLAEQQLGHSEVLNLGVGGIGPPEYALLVEGEGRALDPDLFVVALFVGNDVFFYDRSENVYAACLRAWLDPEQVFACTLPARWRALAREREHAADASLAHAEPAGGERSARTRDEVLAAFPWLTDTAREVPGFSPEAFLHDQSVHAQGLCLGAEANYGPFFAALERIVALAGDRPLGFLVIPEEFQLEDALWSELARAVGEGAERDRPQRLIAAWCAQRGVPCEDLLPRLRALPVQADGRRHAYLVRNTHFNALGNQVAADGLCALVGRLRGSVDVRSR
jgi:hypothetical protein